MYIFVDEEFTGLHKDTTLISIGLVDGKGRTFYAEFLDYDTTQVNSWIQNNVIEKLKFQKPENGEEPYYNIQYEADTELYSIEMQGTKESIKEELLKWLSHYDECIFVMDVGAYDFILLVDLLFGCAINIPSNISAAYHELNNDIAIYKGTTVASAFDFSREDLYKELVEAEPHYNDKHNCLYDAKIIKGIFDGIHNR